MTWRDDDRVELTPAGERLVGGPDPDEHAPLVDDARHRPHLARTDEPDPAEVPLFGRAARVRWSPWD